MTELASPGQLRASLLRWWLFLGPLVLLLGFVSGAVSGSGAGNPWFMGLTKPSLYPPPATFGIVWSLLYLVMGLALAMVVTARGASGRALAVGLFVIVRRRLEGLELRALAATVGRTLVAATVMALVVRLLATLDLPSPIFVVTGIATGAAVYAVVYLALGGREIFGLLRRAPDEIRA